MDPRRRGDFNKYPFCCCECRKVLLGFQDRIFCLRVTCNPFFCFAKGDHALRYTKWQCQGRCQRMIKIGFFPEPFLMSCSMIVNENAVEHLTTPRSINIRYAEPSGFYPEGIKFNTKSSETITIFSSIICNGESMSTRSLSSIFRLGQAFFKPSQHRNSTFSSLKFLKS
jgi:hypothetical protein